MPDHLHAVVYVRRTMPKGIGALTRGFWQAAKRLGRACSYLLTVDDGAAGGAFITPALSGSSSITPNGIRGQLKEDSRRLQRLAVNLRSRLGDAAYYGLAPVFDEMPFIRAMCRYAQLPSTIRYLDLNPQRLATRRLKPGYFRVQRGIAIGDRQYDGVGNVALLHAGHYQTVHVRRAMMAMADHGDTQPLRDYMNTCVLRARGGDVMVSPFISGHERQVMQVLLQERHPIIVLACNGFGDFYKPTDAIFDACASGRLLILSPWPHGSGKRRVSRADCVALNNIAEDICTNLHMVDQYPPSYPVMGKP